MFTPVETNLLCVMSQICQKGWRGYRISARTYRSLTKYVLQLVQRRCASRVSLCNSRHGCARLCKTSEICVGINAKCLSNRKGRTRLRVRRGVEDGVEGLRDASRNARACLARCRAHGARWSSTCGTHSEHAARPQESVARIGGGSREIERRLTHQ